MTTESSRSRRSRPRATAPQGDMSIQAQPASNMTISNTETTDELRAMRILRFRRAVAAGTYFVDSLTIADKLLERLAIFKPKAM
jgi:anti-sigma28 factor (negative regulator of flagellin synthesis)